MPKMLLIDQDKCSGCRSCELACAVAKEGVANPSRGRITAIRWEGEGVMFPMVCQQCHDAPCVAGCPVKALYWDEELGRVYLDYDVCIGCKFCVAICPFGAVGVDTGVRKVYKCDLCDGDPACVKVCDYKAVQFVDVSTANVMKKWEAAERVFELIRRYA